MAAMSLQAIRDYVREHLDIEVEDLEDVVLDRFISQGFDRVVQYEQRWPFYETTSTLTLTVGSTTPVPATLKRVDALVLDGTKLTWISTDEAVVAFNGQSGTPTRWSQWGDQLMFFPTPDQAFVVTYFGYRNPVDWLSGGAGATPDVPELLHHTIALWALHRAYGQQEDLEQAALFQGEFEQELNAFARRLVEMPLERPLVLNGGTKARAPFPPLFDWQV